MHIALAPLDISAAARRLEVPTGVVQGAEGRPEALALPGQRAIESPPRPEAQDGHGHDLSRDQRKRAKGRLDSEEDDAGEQRSAEMSERDREVRRHEAAHAAAAGRHGGSPSFRYERGGDGKRYAVSGEVSIDLTPVKGDPKATIRKMDQVRRAALSPADPSPRDRQVAARAAALAAQARAVLAQRQRAELNLPGGEPTDGADPGAPPEAASAAARKAGEVIDEALQQTAGTKAYLRTLGSRPRALGRPASAPRPPRRSL